MDRVTLEPALGIIAVLLAALCDAAALVVDVGRRAAGLSVGLLLGLGGLAAGVGSGHDCLSGRELDLPSCVGGGRIGSVRFGMCLVLLCWWEVCDADQLTMPFLIH